MTVDLDTSADARDTKYVEHQIRTNMLVIQYRARMLAAREKLHKIALDVSEAVDVVIRNVVDIPVPSIDRSRSTPRTASVPPAHSYTRLIAPPTVNVEAAPAGMVYHFTANKTPG